MPHPRYDGKALPPPYKAPEYTGLEPTAEVENGKICELRMRAILLFVLL